MGHLDIHKPGSKVTADGDCSHEIKRCLLLGRNVMTNLDSILKADITFPTKAYLAKAMVFPVVIRMHLPGPGDPVPVWNDSVPNVRMCGA